MPRRCVLGNDPARLPTPANTGHEVRILDLNDAEARTLLLSFDPLAALAETQQALHDRLMELAPTPALELLAAWQAEALAALTKFARPLGEGDSEKALHQD